MQQLKNFHIPVLKKEVTEYLLPSVGKTFIDCTFGAGGHTEELLKHGSRVIAIDRDENSEKFAFELQKKYCDSLVFINAKFSQLEEILEKYNFIHSKDGNDENKQKLDGILYDIGVSSMQIDQSERGFSFQKEGRLDMRMGQNNMTAADIVNCLNEQEISDIIYKYGNERFAKKIAKIIIENRAKAPILSTLQLADLIKNNLPFYHDKIHPATRTFQALRIVVNDELQELEKSLNIASKLTPVGCKIAVITFHSLEDKIVKNIFQKYANGDVKHFNRNEPEILLTKTHLSSITLKVLTKKPITPNDEEIKKNIRSRSAKLRIAERIETF